MFGPWPASPDWWFLAYRTMSPSVAIGGSRRSSATTTIGSTGPCLPKLPPRRTLRFWAYCLMPNHVRIILTPGDPDGLRRTLADLHRRYTAHINARNRWTGHLRQGRFGSVAMDEAHLFTAARYVSLNPVRARLTARAEDWLWSSVRAHLAGRDDGVVKVAPLLERIGDRDKISDLTTNIIRFLLIQYTQQQCEILGIPIRAYSGPPGWDKARRNWLSKIVDLPFIGESPVILIPKYVVRRKLSLDSQEFYNKQITDFLVSENLRANSSLVQTIKGQQKVFKSDVRKENPKTKNYVAEMVVAHPELLEIYKKIAKRQKTITNFNDTDPSINAVCSALADIFANIPAGTQHAEDYHLLAMGTLTAIFYPDLIMPHKEWEIHGGRKRIDLVYTNAADTGFFCATSR